DPEHGGAVAGGGMDREAAPAAADVQYPLPWAQSELDADQLELCLLGFLERARAAFEVSAAVRHRAIEEQREELVADVVVVAHGPEVAGQRVALATQPQLRLRPRRRGGQPVRAND